MKEMGLPGGEISPINGVMRPLLFFNGTVAAPPCENLFEGISEHEKKQNKT